MVEVNCETDFVGKDANFRAFVDAVAMAAAQNDVADVDGLAKSACPGAESISAAREGLVMKLGENISVRRFVRFQLGEGIEKKVDDFAAEVMAAVKG